MSKRKSSNRPREIPMTDLGWSEDGQEINHTQTNDSHAAGTPGGGTASGGLAGTNIGHGDPTTAELEDALGSGILDSAGEDQGAPGYSGSSGGAVGGTPAGKRSRGGRTRSRLDSRDTHRPDTTVGNRPE